MHDVFVAYPLWLDDRAAARLRDLAERATVAFGVDSVDAAANAGRLLGGTDVEVVVEVDSGLRRVGMPTRATPGGWPRWRRARAWGCVASSPSRGTPTPPAAAPPRRTTSAAPWRRPGTSVRAEGLEVRVVSGGSTPSLRDTDTSTVTEVRPGVYVFGDAQQWELGTMAPEDIALTAVGTVVSHAGGRAVLDAGSKVLGADRAAYATGFGRLLDHPDARIVALSEHHAVVDLGGAPLPRLGETVRVVPNHVCAAVNLADELWVEEQGVLHRVAGVGTRSQRLSAPPLPLAPCLAA